MHYVGHVGQLSWTTFITVFIHNVCTWRWRQLHAHIVCHFVMQARALRVPEVCVNHTPPSCSVAYPFTKLEYQALNTLVLPDPCMAHTQEGPVTFLACALYQLFVRSCNLAYDGQHCSHICAYTYRSLLLHLSLVLR